jgi:hypothetical protein
VAKGLGVAGAGARRSPQDPAATICHLLAPNFNGGRAVSPQLLCAQAAPKLTGHPKIPLRVTVAKGGRA